MAMVMSWTSEDVIVESWCQFHCTLWLLYFLSTYTDIITTHISSLYPVFELELKLLIMYAVVAIYI